MKERDEMKSKGVTKTSSKSQAEDHVSQLSKRIKRERTHASHGLFFLDRNGLERVDGGNPGSVVPTAVPPPVPPPAVPPPPLFAFVLGGALAAV